MKKLSFLMLFAVFSSSMAQTTQEFMPSSCVEPDKIQRLYATIYGNDTLKSYDCNINGKVWTVKVGHLAYIMQESKTYAGGKTNFVESTRFDAAGGYDDHVAYESPPWQGKFSTMPYTDPVTKQKLSIKFLLVGYFRDKGNYGELFQTVMSPSSNFRSGQSVTFSDWVNAKNNLKDIIRTCFSTAEVSYKCSSSSYGDFTNKLLPQVVSRNLTANVAPISPDNGGGGSGGSGGVSGGDSSPPEQPTDSESNCSIIDIPCNLRWLFVPSENYLSEAVNGVQANYLTLPIRSVDHLCFSTAAYFVHDICLDFGEWHRFNGHFEPLRLIAFSMVFLYVYGYFGLPSLFGSRQSEGSSGDSLGSDGWASDASKPFSNSGTGRMTIAEIRAKAGKK